MGRATSVRVVVAVEPRLLREAIGRALLAHDVVVADPDGDGPFDVALVTDDLGAGIRADEVIHVGTDTVVGLGDIVGIVERRRSAKA